MSNFNFPIDAFLDSAFGDDATLTTSSPETVSTIRVYLHVDPADAVVTNEHVVGTEIYADGKDLDFQNAKTGDSLEVSSVDYEIINVEPQGNGWVRVQLAKE